MKHSLKFSPTLFLTLAGITGMASQNGPLKTFPLRGIKASPLYLHDGSCR